MLESKASDTTILFWIFLKTKPKEKILIIVCFGFIIDHIITDNFRKTQLVIVTFTLNNYKELYFLQLQIMINNFPIISFIT